MSDENYRHRNGDLKPFAGNDFLNPVPQLTEEPQTAWIAMVDRIVRTIRVKIQRLRIHETCCTHSRRINLGESSLLRVVVAIDSVIDPGCRGAIIRSESSIRRAGRAA